MHTIVVWLATVQHILAYTRDPLPPPAEGGARSPGSPTLQQPHRDTRGGVGGVGGEGGGEVASTAAAGLASTQWGKQLAAARTLPSTPAPTPTNISAGTTRTNAASSAASTHSVGAGAGAGAGAAVGAVGAEYRLLWKRAFAEPVFGVSQPSSTPPQRGSLPFRPPICTYTPRVCGVNARADALAKSRRMPTLNYYFPITARDRYQACRPSTCPVTAWTSSPSSPCESSSSGNRLATAPPRHTTLNRHVKLFFFLPRMA